MRREPALIIGVLSAALSLFGTLGFDWLTAEQAAWAVAVVTAVGGAVTAAFTRPIAPAAFTGVVVVVADLVAAYGFNVSQQTVGAVNALLLVVLTLITREQVTPVAPALSGPRST